MLHLDDMLLIGRKPSLAKERRLEVPAAIVRIRRSDDGSVGVGSGSVEAMVGSFATVDGDAK
jgi:hypothetical protein